MAAQPSTPREPATGHKGESKVMSISVARGAAFAAAVILATGTTAQAQQKFSATVAGHALLPAMTLVPPPADAPATLKISGRYAATAGTRIDAPESIVTNSALS